MQKRGFSPLMAILACIVAVAVIMNVTAQAPDGHNHGKEQEHKDEASPIQNQDVAMSGPRDVPSPEAVGELVKASRGSGDSRQVDPSEKASKATSPTIFLPEISNTKPTPSESATSSQWYDRDHHEQEKSGN